MNKNSPQPGQRAPDVLIKDKKYLSYYLRDTYHHVLLFTGLNPGAAKINKLKKINRELGKLPFPIKIHLVSAISLNETNVIFDPELAIHQRYEMKKQAVYIVRPDNYIAYYSKNIDVNNIKEFLLTYLKDGEQE